MSLHSKDYVKYRIEKAYESYKDAITLIGTKSWNASMNRFYYASYYMVSALLFSNKIETKTHSGVKINFNQYFVKSQLVTIASGKLFSDLFDSRQKGDYGDMFDFDEETILSLVNPVLLFLQEIESKISFE